MFNTVLYLIIPSVDHSIGTSYGVNKPTVEFSAIYAVHQLLFLFSQLHFVMFLADDKVLRDFNKNNDIGWTKYVSTKAKDGVNVLHFGTFNKTNCDEIVTHLKYFTCIYGTPNIILEPHLHDEELFYLKLLYFDPEVIAKPSHFIVEGFLWDVTLFEPFQLTSANLGGIELLIPSPASEFVTAAQQNHFIGCNLTRRDEFLHIFPEQRNLQGTTTALQFQRKVRNVLDKVLQALNTIKVPIISWNDKQYYDEKIGQKYLLIMR